MNSPRPRVSPESAFAGVPLLAVGDRARHQSRQRAVAQRRDLGNPSWV
jgi:hypothetical protein